MRTLFLAALVLLVLAAPASPAAAGIRIATWNIHCVGQKGSVAYEAAKAIFARVSPDIVGINEVGGGDAGNADLADIAAEAGYPHFFIGTPTTFIGYKNAVLSKFPLSAASVHTSSELSGDINAYDLYIHPVSVVVDTPEGALGLVVGHFKPGLGDASEFHRSAQSLRMVQIAEMLPQCVPFVVMGDMNEQLIAMPRSPNPLTEIPAEMPEGYTLGSDIASLLPSPGLVNDPFAALSNPSRLAMHILDTPQLDGVGTNRFSQRYDYIFLDLLLASLGAVGQVYDSEDEAAPQQLPLWGTPLPASTSDDASDHLLVFADVVLSNPVPTMAAWRFALVAFLLALAGACGASRSATAR